MQSLAEETLSAINSLTSAALIDGEISDEKYQEIIKKYEAFTSRKTRLRYSNHSGNDSPDDKKEYFESSRLKTLLRKVFK